MNHTSPSLIAEPTSADPQELLQAIKDRGWWQGSVISSTTLGCLNDGQDGVEYWVIASQACNIYNSDFEKVPVFEVVGATAVQKLNPALMKGDNPRVLHVEAQGHPSMNLSLEIQKRRWLPRRLLTQLPKAVAEVQDPAFSVKDAPRWLDNLAGWLGRSYTRIALPDAFNTAIEISRLKDVFDKLLKDHHNDLYGIYFVIGSDTEWEGRLGEMPSPYNLGIILAVNEVTDPEEVRAVFMKRAFVDEIKDPHDEKAKITRVNLASRHGIRLIAEGVEVRNVSEISLSDLRTMVRYSLVDHLSDSTFAA